MDDGRRQAPIGDHALIGDTRTAALVDPAGSVDWMCLPRFDGDPIFGRLADQRHGGEFSVEVPGARVVERAYLDRTATIETTVRSATGGALLRDGMVLDASSGLRPGTLLVRHVRCTDGQVEVEVRFDPRRGMPGRPIRCERRSGALIATAGSIAIALATEPSLPVQPRRPARVMLGAGETLTVTMSCADREPLVLVAPETARAMLRDSERWWRTWCTEIREDVPERDAVIRSLITLRLLTYAPSGAPVAAPTTSIPAPPGSERAWDYRYSWPRDAGIGIGAFLALRGPDEPAAWMRWLRHATQNTKPRINVLSTLDGRPGPEERTLRGLRDGGEVVRVGNGAATQHQLDVYGYVADAAWSMRAAGHDLDRGMVRAIASFTDFVAGHWREPDSGIWEVRDHPAHYVHSKAMAWVTLDRALRLCRPNRRRRASWQRQRDRLEAEIREQGFDAGRGTYLRRYGSPELDASLLTLPGLGLDEPAAYRGTIDAIRRELGAGGPLLFRYPAAADGLDGGESAFVACSFWLAKALAEIGDVDEASEVLDDMCARATPLGLYAEQIDPDTGAHQGNFPQALSHSAMLQAAVAISAAAESRPGSLRTPRARASSPPASPRRS